MGPRKRPACYALAVDALDARPGEPSRVQGPPERAAPLSDRRIGPLRLLLYPPRHPTADIEVAFALVGAAVLAALFFLPLDSLAALMPECRFHDLTGWPCATCGITRGIVALGKGDWSGALRCNPLLVGGLLLFLPGAVVAAVLWALRLPRPRVALASRGARLAAGLAVVAAILVNWAFLVADGR
jgi:hypothetical protein